MNRLIAAIKALIARIRGTHSVDSVLSAVHGAIARLEAVADHHDTLATIHQKIEDEAAYARQLAMDEVSKAYRLQAKIKALIS